MKPNDKILQGMALRLDELVNDVLENGLPEEEPNVIFLGGDCLNPKCIDIRVKPNLKQTDNEIAQNKILEVMDRINELRVHCIDKEVSKEYAILKSKLTDVLVLIDDKNR